MMDPRELKTGENHSIFFENAAPNKKNGVGGHKKGPHNILVNTQTLGKFLFSGNLDRVNKIFKMTWIFLKGESGM